MRDRLFHTLDPTTRTLELGGRTHLLTDTVGFISKLPHQLVDAFGATLEETSRAELLVHVLDASAPEDQLELMKRSVEGTLEEIGAGERPRLLVLNKIDLLDDDAREQLRFHHPEARARQRRHGRRAWRSCASASSTSSRTRCARSSCSCPYADGGSLAELHELAGEVSREDTAEGVRVHALVPARLAQRFARFAVAPQRV